MSELRQRRPIYCAVKRLLDIIGALVVLALSAPLQVVIALVVRVDLGRPILYRQARAGRNGATFTLLKFRTMRDVGGCNGPAGDALRLTRVGRFLRSWSLDELPSMVNVLKGDMSLVGPRPLLPEYVDRYTAEEARRLDVRPGVTGLAQVSGRNNLGWEERLALDLEYVERCSTGLDLRILVKTIAKVLAREGIAAPGQATMSEFRPRPEAEADVVVPEGRSAHGA